MSDNRAYEGSVAAAIFTVGATLLSDSIVRDNLAVAGSTGGISSSGTMTLKTVTVSGNGAEFGSGGISSVAR